MLILYHQQCCGNSRSKFGLRLCLNVSLDITGNEYQTPKTTIPPIPPNKHHRAWCLLTYGDSGASTIRLSEVILFLLVLNKIDNYQQFLPRDFPDKQPRKVSLCSQNNLFF